MHNARHIDQWTLQQLMAANDRLQRCVWFTWDDKSQALVPFVRSNGKGPSGCEALGPELVRQGRCVVVVNTKTEEAPGNKT